MIRKYTYSRTFLKESYFLMKPPREYKKIPASSRFSPLLKPLRSPADQVNCVITNETVKNMV